MGPLVVMQMIVQTRQWLSQKRLAKLLSLAVTTP